QIVLKTHVELRATRVTLATGTTTQLAIDPAAVVFLSTDDRQTTGLFHTSTQLDVRTTTGHVRGNGHRSGITRLLHDLRFALVLFRVQYVVRDVAHLEHLAHQLAHLHARGTYQHRTTLCLQCHDLLDHRVVFLALGLEDHVLS